MRPCLSHLDNIRGTRAVYGTEQYDFCTNSQFMQTILIMVSVKKGTGVTSTLTKTAVSRNTTRITVRQPEMRSF